MGTQRRSHGWFERQRAFLAARYADRRENCRCVWCKKRTLFRALCDDCRAKNNARARAARKGEK